MKSPKIIRLLIVALVLASCTPATKAVPTVAFISTSTWIPVLSTSTVTPSPTVQPLTCNIIPTPTPQVDEDIFTANHELDRTINLGEALEFPGGGHWQWINKEETFYMVKTAGFNAVRLPVDFAYNAESAFPYTISSSFWENVDSVIGKAIACHLVVVLNMQNFRGEAQVPYSQHEQFITLWSEIADHYKSYPDNVLYFEPYNEPGDPGYWNVLISDVIPVIRKNNKTSPNHS